MSNEEKKNKIQEEGAVSVTGEEDVSEDTSAVREDMPDNVPDVREDASENGDVVRDDVSAVGEELPDEPAAAQGDFSITLEDDEADNDMEEKIEAAMEKIVTDIAGSVPPQPVSADKRPPITKGISQSPSGSYGAGQSGAKRAKSARPKPVTYVPVDDLELPLNPVRRKHKGLKVTGIVAAMLVVAAGCAYGAGTYYYADKFFEGTTINGIDCSGKTPYEVEKLIAERVEDYSIQVASRNLEPQTINGADINYSYMSNGEIVSLLKKQKPYEWIRGFQEQKSYTVAENISYDKVMLQEQIKGLDCAKEENQVAPVNAYVAFNETQFEIVPETEGSKLDIKQAYQILDAAVAESQETVDFSSTPDAYVKADVTKDDPDLKAAADACNNFTRASITYTFGEETVTLDGTTIKDWLQFDEKGQLIRDDATFQQHIVEFVGQLAYDHDTVGTEREFYTTSGRVVYVWGSAYGWQIDQAAEAAQLTQEIQSGTQTVRDPVYSMTANSHGVNDLGDTYIEVDLSAQHMYYYQNGSIIFDSDFVSGNMSYPDRQTPSGIYTLYYKKSPDVLRGTQKPDGTYEYEQPVTYWMPFNGGVGFHDATWQPYFGGDRYLTGGSHGCINLPYDSAATLYSIIEYGVPIVCFY